MISEEKLIEILREMEKNLAVLANELSINKIKNMRILDISEKIYDQNILQKIALQKFYLDWINAEIEENSQTN